LSPVIDTLKRLISSVLSGGGRRRRSFLYYTLFLPGAHPFFDLRGILWYDILTFPERNPL
jgi:hypothetical protein